VTRRAWIRLAGFGVAVLALHAIGIGLLVAYGGTSPMLAGLGWTAYLFGLRHAFDADHIAAIDNTTRKLVQNGERPVGVGFFFSLGHSTVVFGLAFGLAVATRAVGAGEAGFARYGPVFGTGVSALFLWAIGILNLLVLIDVVRGARSGMAAPAPGGLMTRLLGRFGGLVRRSWQMFPLGFLFGLGFDTASEISLLALAAGAATGSVPVGAIVALPVLFAAGMALMDTADGAFMTHAYGWAFSNPVRKLYYNITVTSLSVAVALLVGTVELVQVASGRLSGLDFELLGYAVVGLFVLIWACSYAVWRGMRIEERWGERVAPPA
jgi:nickel/cobalt transporter (NiCoT) family protein